MRFQDMIIESTQQAANEAFRYAAATAPDKLDWKPLDAGRSVLDQAREMAKCPDWAASLLNDSQEGEGDMGAEEMASWATIEECQAACNAKLAALFDVIRAFPDEKLKETRWLPYDGGRDFTFAEMMDYPRWNYNYHLGQIGYIQTLYGDKDMH